MSQQAETSQTAAATSPVALPREIVANAADIVMAELLTLHDHRNKQYWQKAMHVIWEQLTRVHPLVEELPSKFTIPTHIITAEMVMRDPVVLTAVKEWLDFDKIRDATDADVVDHPWYQIGRPVDKGKGCTVPLEPLQISDTAPAAAETLEEPRSRSTSRAAPTGTRPRSRRPPKHTSPSPGPSAMISSEPTTPAWQTHKRCAATRGMTPTAGKATTSATPSSHRQIFDGVVIVTPSWWHSGRQTSSPASRWVATSQSRLTTPSHPVMPNATSMEHMEEEIAALRQQHMETVQDLLDTCCELANTQWALADTWTELQTLADVVKALWQCLYPLPHSSPNAPGPSRPSAVGFAITSHQAVVPTDGARILDLAPTTMVQEVAINTGILQSLPGDMLLAPSTFLLPTHCFPYSSTAGVGEAPPPYLCLFGGCCQ
ncbi:hypothetical protein BKA82DRAFT_34945 [Pisolithus tinctorius]|uniref:Uncharacterized protein n=1 Tax=Pisolithus tinctorius Marx 270 TaxID=870435 RepID=A0A0C3JA29_PISTI|nr:hypothetical protein BKA82DRAFT_34945 [Pisolithus tinctorius]KIN94551.1 hypothetical protein M404DRAFT_34945 [Pisolithus tinctorius Marx 270]